MKERADKLAVDQGLAETRRQAQALIMAGLIFSRNGRVEKAGQMLMREEPLTRKATLPFVSRAGLKLQEALSRFRLEVKDRIAADLGASTGGFTDCLLQSGAARVYAVDVDTRQLDWRLRRDPRVVLIEKNARFLEPDDIPETLDLITMDLSFISVLKVLPAVAAVAGDSPIVALVKPQFEAGRGKVGKKGVIRDPARHAEILERVINSAGLEGFTPVDVCGTSTRGQKGNREFFVRWSKCAAAERRAAVPDMIKEAVWNEEGQANRNRD